MWNGTHGVRALSAATRSWLARWLYLLLFALGGLFLLAAALYAGYSLLNTWLMAQDRYLRGHDIAPLPLDIATWTASPTPPSSMPLSTATSTLLPMATARDRSRSTATVSPGPGPTDTPRTSGALEAPEASSTPTDAPTATPSPTAAPHRPASSEPSSRPVKVRIPALGVDRSIVELPRTRDRRTGTWTWNADRLFRSGRQDLVGHWEGSANPGERGNMILVGHNYGYGYNGVFVHLGRLRPGDQVRIVNKTGQTFTYRVKTVERVKWRRKSFGELTQHLSFLSTGGPEHLTLVSCAGADFEPFPERIYVVAEPAK